MVNKTPKDSNKNSAEYSAGAMAIQDLIRSKSSNNKPDSSIKLLKNIQENTEYTFKTVEELIKTNKQLLGQGKKSEEWTKKVYTELRNKDENDQLDIGTITRALQQGLKGGNAPLGSTRGPGILDNLFGGGRNKFRGGIGTAAKKPGFLGKLFKFGGAAEGAEAGLAGEAALGGEAVAGGGLLASAAIPLAIGATIAATVGVITHWKESKALLKGALQEGDKLLKQAGPVVGHLIQSAIPAAQDLLKNVFDSFKGDGGKEFMSDVGKLFDNLKSGLKDMLSKLGEGAGSLARDAVDYVTDLLKPENLKKMLDDAIKGIKQAPAKVMEAAHKAADLIGKDVSAAIDIAKNIGGGIIKFGGKAIDLGKEGLGVVARGFESGWKGNQYGTISSGKGDAGGVSYGAYQFESSKGTVNRFLQSSGYENQFKGLEVNSDAFKNKWKELSKDASFRSAQDKYAASLAIGPLLSQLKKHGGEDIAKNLLGRGRGVKEMLFSLGNSTPVLGAKAILGALTGQDLSKMSDAQVINAVQGYFGDHVDSYYKKSDAKTRAGRKKRAIDEAKVEIAIGNAATEMDNSAPNKSSKNSTPQNANTPAPQQNSPSPPPKPAATRPPPPGSPPLTHVLVAAPANITSYNSTHGEQ